MLEQPKLERLLSIALDRGGDFADVFVEHRVSNMVACEESRVERVNSGREEGVGVRVVWGEATAYAFTNDMDRTSLEKAARAAGEAARSESAAAIGDLRRHTPGQEFPVRQRPGSVPVEARVSVVERANREARAVDQRVRQVMVTYGDVCHKIQVANSLGDLVEDERIRTRLNINVVAAQGQVIQTGYEVLGGVAGFELLAEEEVDAMARRAARRAVLMLDAEPAPAGQMPVVMAAEAGGTMIHEACGHGLEADLAHKGLSVYAGQVGERVAAPGVTVYDDATLPGRYGSYAFDDEGVPSRRTVLIEDGVLQGFLTDRLYAGLEDQVLTGNGRRQSFAHRPLPRMSNTCVARGTVNPQEIIDRAQFGLLVKRMGGGQVNTTTGDFVFDVSEAYLIEKGRVGRPVRGATLTGNGPEVLRNINAVGNDWGFAIGVCGKDGQGVPVGDAQPTLAIDGLIVGSTET